MDGLLIKTSRNFDDIFQKSKFLKVDIRELLKEVSLKENVVVIVPSETAAQDWDALG